MSENIIRKDLIQISFDIDNSGLTQANKEMAQFKTSLTGGIDNGLTKMSSGVKKVTKDVKDTTTATKGLKTAFDDVEKSSESISRATKKFQSVNRAIQDGGAVLNKFKSNIKNLPHNTITKISDAMTKCKVQSSIVLGTFKSLAKTKIGNLKTDVNATVQALKQGEKGGKGFVNMLKSIGKISVNKMHTGLTKVKTSLKEGTPLAEKMKKSLKDFASTSFTKIKTDLSKVKTHLSTIAKKAGGAALTGLKKLASVSFKTLVAGLAGAAVAVGKFASLASDLEETKNKVDVAFGSGLGKFDGSAKDVMEWSKKSTTKMGLAQQTALDTAALFGDMGTSMGFTKDKAAEMSMALTQQAADIASFKNLSIDEATTALNGIFTGETESLKRLGVVMTQTNLEQYALNKGIKKSIDDMTEAEKVQLRYNYVMEKTKNATGDYERTGGGFANQLRTLTENFKQLGATLGQLPMKKLASGMKVVNDGLAQIQNILSDGIQEGDTDKIMNIVNGLIDKGIKALADGIPVILPKVLKVLSTVAEGLVKAIPKIAPVLATGVVDLMIGLGKIIIDNRHLLVNAAREVVAAIVKAIYKGFTGKEMSGSMFEGLQSTIKGITATIGGVVGGILAISGISKITGVLSKVKGLFGGGKGGSNGKGGFLSGLLGLGEIKPTTILKAMGNLAIVIGGFTIIGAAVAAVAPHIAKLSDGKSFIKMLGIITGLGLVGSGLAKLAGIVGVIPVSVVAKGMAGIAIAIGGMTAIIAAFGALSKIKGFNEFITSGGDTLANLFRQVGKIAGAVIGGIGEGISGSLPKIGEDLTAFANAIKPMISTFQGVDMSGIGSFFGSLGSFMLKMAANDIFSFFTGGTNLGKLGKELNTFAEKSAGFFTKVATFPEAGFTRATQLFECLAGLKSLPKEGGVVGWFTGSINYDSLAKGLGKLSSEKVIGFFNAVSTLKQAGFDNGKALFDCLAGLKSLPKEGGVVGWFAGKVDYSKIATGLGHLSGEKVKNFFTMVGGLNSKAFENTKLFFESLANIGKLPKEGGWWDKLTGKETSTLGNIAKELGSFGEKTESFFKQVNGLNLGNLNGLWASLKNSETVTANVSKVVGDNIKDIVNKVSKLPIQMGEGLKKSGKSLADALVSVWKDAVKASVAPVNKVLEAANWIMKEFGSEKRVTKWKPYAKGTDGHKGGNAVVNDGRGAELVQMPNGNAFIPKGRNVFIPNAPKGMKVLPADRTAQLMGKKSPTFNYANGIGDIDLWSYIDNPKGLVGAISQSVSYDGMSGLSLNIGKGMVSTITGEMSAWVKKIFDEAGALSLADYVASKGVEQWRTTVIRALKMEGLYSAANVERTLFQMQTESGGNPRAINLWDSNAKKGIPSKGLMQVIDPTFRAYARAGFDKNIYDPLSNILASVRYAVSRYGSLTKAYRGVGYANGGIATKPSIFGEDGKEMAIPLSKDKRNRGISLWAQTGEMLGLSSYTPESDSGTYTTNTVENNNYSPQFVLNISGTNDDRSMARKVKRWIQEAIDETFDSFDSKNPKLREV